MNASENGVAPRPRIWQGLFLLTLAGFVVRCAFLLLEPAVEPAGDEPTWLMLGVKVLAESRRPLGPFKPAVSFYPPAYPYFIAVVYLLFKSLTAVKWAQAAVGALLIPAVGRVGGKAFSRRTGWIAAAIAAFYPDLIWFSVHFWSETLFMVFLWWTIERVLAADQSARDGPAGAAGLLCGLAALTRETALHFAPFLALYLAWSGRGTGGRRRSLFFLLALVLTVAPWTWRNYKVFHAFVPISTFGPLNLWQGNAGLPRAEFYRRVDAFQDPIEQYRFTWAQAMKVIRERQPRWIFEKLRHEMPAFWEMGSEATEHIERGAYGRVRPLFSATAQTVVLAPYLAVLALFVPGLVAFGWQRQRLLLLLLLAYHNAIHVISYGAHRYRLPVTPVLFILAAAAWTAWRDGSFPRFGPRQKALLLIIAAVLFICLIPSLVGETASR